MILYGSIFEYSNDIVTYVKKHLRFFEGIAMYLKVFECILPYPSSRIGTHLPNHFFFQKNVVWHMLISTNILQYSFIFRVNFFFGKK
jgi:hypothetical protein